MRYQKTNYSCGAAAIANALRCFGKKIPERTLIKLSETNKDGADEHNIRKALTSLSYPHQEIAANTPPAILDPTLNSGQPIIMSVDNAKHWVTVIGKVGDRYILVDSTNTIVNKKENGVHLISRRELLRRWRCKNEPYKYYGISVGKK